MASSSEYQHQPDVSQFMHGDQRLAVTTDYIMHKHAFIVTFWDLPWSCTMNFLSGDSICSLYDAVYATLAILHQPARMYRITSVQHLKFMRSYRKHPRCVSSL
jgi:hypothetical protein